MKANLLVTERPHPRALGSKRGPCVQRRACRQAHTHTRTHARSGTAGGRTLSAPRPIPHSTSQGRRFLHWPSARPRP